MDNNKNRLDSCDPLVGCTAGKYLGDDTRKAGPDYGAQTEGCAVQSYGNSRRIIDRLIDYHNRQSVQLHALLRALPQDLSREAEAALYDLAKTALGSIR